ncbi:uncharacterized protein LDX57_008599 [Aspergillus melleus]|uniref:uncharacterized protein n=1 Tax=Aspergillus melleus TaxID=138277 RepID=UPI001E8DBCFC|nr:uncharacterized protein LDX57_008599 [Aspergillus melleus]KAH8430936.1 hypothetical protein LDX57_008599 [Aspergillus melleus]
MGESLLKALVNRPPRNLEHLRIVNFGISHDKLPLESLKPVIENLRSLSICSDVKQRGDATTESGLYSALRYARKLRELKIEGATDAPQTSFNHLLPEAPLRALDISGLFFTFDGICEISKFAKTLTTLYITHNWLTDGTWAEFIETLWDFPLLNNGLLGPNYYVKDTMTTAGQEVTDEQECHSFHKKKMTAREAWVSNDTLEY